MTAVAAVAGYSTKAHCVAERLGTGKYTHLC